MSNVLPSNTPGQYFVPVPPAATDYTRESEAVSLVETTGHLNQFARQIEEEGGKIVGSISMPVSVPRRGMGRGTTVEITQFLIVNVE